MPIRRIAIFTFTALTLIFTNRPCAATQSLWVDESATRVDLLGTQLSVSLATVNNSGGEVASKIKVELLETSNQPWARADAEGAIKPGAGSINASIPIAPDLLELDPEYLLRFRLRYRVSPQGRLTKGVAPFEGVIALSRIMPALFTLHVAGPDYGVEGGRYRAVVGAAHPTSTRPAPGVRIEAKLALGDAAERPAVKTSGVTNADGYFTLEFQLPRIVEPDDCKIEIIGSRDNLIERVESDLRLLRGAQALLSTDKPLYQPGQLLHLRALVLDESRRPIPNTDGTLTIRDPEGSTVSRSSLRTSRFGVASADWVIPESARLGEYDAEIKLDSERYPDSAGRVRIKVSRYDLPNFRVTVTSDRPYYMPGQTALADVRATTCLASR